MTGSGQLAQRGATIILPCSLQGCKRLKTLPTAPFTPSLSLLSRRYIRKGTDRNVESDVGLLVKPLRDCR